MPPSRGDDPHDPGVARARRDARLALTANLRALRAAAGLSQAELAERAGLSVVYVNALEGLGTQQNPTLSTLAVLAHALGCGPDRLLAPAPPPTRRPVGRPAASARPALETKKRARRSR